MEDQESRKIQARKRKLSQLTSLIKQIEQLMEEDVNVDTVKNKLCVDFSGLQMDFLEINPCLQKFMEEEEFVDDQTSWSDPINKSMDMFFWKCEEWMKEVLRRAEHAEECDKHITTANNRSTTTKVTTRSKATSQSGSSASSASSVRLKAEIKRVSLRTKAAAL